MHHRTTRATTVVAEALLVGVFAFMGTARVASAGDPAATATAADVSRLQGDIVLMKQEMREQRQLILQLMQMHDALLKYVTSGGTGVGALPQSLYA